MGFSGWSACISVVSFQGSKLRTRSLALQARFQPQARLLSRQKRRLIRAFPEMQHGDKKRTLTSLRDALGLDHKNDNTHK